MAQRRHHYERAFEEYLRSRRIPYVSVDEAKKALLPDNASFRIEHPAGPDGSAARPSTSLKSFDFVIYGQGGNLLIDIKGRRVASRGRAGALHDVDNASRPAPRSRLESWVTLDDIESLRHWQTLFGPEFQPAFVFVYWCDQQPPDALFQEIFEYRGRWYALRAVTLEAYVRVMKPRSVRWRTVDVPAARFEEVSQPFTDARQIAARPDDLPLRDPSSGPATFLPGLATARRDARQDFGPQLPALHAHGHALGST